MNPSTSCPIRCPSGDDLRRMPFGYALPVTTLIPTRRTPCGVCLLGLRDHDGQDDRAIEVGCYQGRLRFDLICSANVPSFPSTSIPSSMRSLRHLSPTHSEPSNSKLLIAAVTFCSCVGIGPFLAIAASTLARSSAVMRL